MIAGMIALVITYCVTEGTFPILPSWVWLMIGLVSICEASYVYGLIAEVAGTISGKVIVEEGIKNSKSSQRV